MNSSGAPIETPHLDLEAKFIGEPADQSSTQKRSVRLRDESWSFHHLLTLGINYSQMHDSSACIVRDGEIVHGGAKAAVLPT